MGFWGASDSKKSNWAVTNDAMVSFTSPWTQMMRSRNKREKMSKDRSPKEPLSKTMGTVYWRVEVVVLLMMYCVVVVVVGRQPREQRSREDANDMVMVGCCWGCDLPRFLWCGAGEAVPGDVGGVNDAILFSPQAKTAPTAENSLSLALSDPFLRVRTRPTTNTAKGVDVHHSIRRTRTAANYTSI